MDFINITQRKAAQRVARLSPRQYQTLYLLMTGYSFKQTAVMMKISYQTIAAHIFVARRKLGAANLAQAAAIMMISGMVKVKDEK